MADGVPREMVVSCKPEYAAYEKAAGSSTKFIISLKAPPTVEDKRAPVSVSVVLDRSGSMAGSKLDLVKKTTNFLLSQLNEQDQVSVITYDDNVEVPVPLQNATHGNKESARARVKAIQAGSCTNLSGGLFKGIQQQISSSKEPGDWQIVDRCPVKAVFLFTDGLANVGLSDSNSIVSAMTKLMAGGSGGSLMPSIQSSLKKLFSSKAKEAPSKPDAAAALSPLMVHTFGFGSDHDAAMLQNIATAGNGTYFFIEKNENIPMAFADALGGLMSVYAQNIELEIKPAMPGVTIRKVHTGFKQSQVGASHRVEMSDIYCEERKDLILELDLPAAALEGRQTLAVASLSYIDVMAGVERRLDVHLDVTRVTQLPDDLNPDEEIAAHWTRIEAARAMEEAVQLAERGDLERAKQVMRDARESAQSSINICAAGNAELRAPLGNMLKNITDDLVECEACFDSVENYRSTGSKKARSHWISHKAQRSNGRWGAQERSAPGGASPSAAPTNVYANAVQAQMSRAAQEAVLEEEAAPAAQAGGVAGPVLQRVALPNVVGPSQGFFAQAPQQPARRRFW